MDAGWLARLRWRRRGAWMWPAFIAATVLDGVIGKALPPEGESQSLASGLLVGLMANLIAVVVLSRPLAVLLRRARTDLPAIVARDYGGTLVVSTIAGLVLLAGLLHHATVMADRHAMQDAIVRAQAFIGDRAPAEFRRNLQWVDTFAIQPGSIYRMCVPNSAGTRTYCVVVNTRLPFQRSVRFSGYEPNFLFSEGVD